MFYPGSTPVSNGPELSYPFCGAIPSQISDKATLVERGVHVELSGNDRGLGSFCRNAVAAGAGARNLRVTVLGHTISVIKPVAADDIKPVKDKVS